MRKFDGGAEAILDEFGVSEEMKLDILAHPRSVDPGALLIEEIERSAGVIDWLEGRIAALDEDTEFIYDVIVTTQENGSNAQGAIDSTKTETRKEIHHYWRMLEKERAHLAQVTTSALRAGVEERRVRLAERSVSALEAAMSYALMELGLDPHNERVRGIVGTSLRKALESGVTGDMHLMREGESEKVLVVPAGKQTPVQPVQF